MQKIGVYIILVVIGVIIGASIIGYLTINQNSNIAEQVKVTIQGIEYKITDSVLEIELLNNAPERNLEGEVRIYQDENQWTGDVIWQYTGYGEAEIVCDSIDETKSFQVTYTENNLQATYLDRMVQWNEITINNEGATGSQAGALISVENVRFFVDEQIQRIEIILRNSGTADAKVETVYVGNADSNLVAQTVDSFNPTTQIVAGGSTLTITIEYAWQDGTRYYFNIATEEGISFPFSKECSGVTFTFMETEELRITSVNFDTSNANMTVNLQNVGTQDVIISSAKVTGNGVTATDDLSANITFDVDGTTTSMVIDVSGTLSAGSTYNIELLSSKGNRFSYTATA